MEILLRLTAVMLMAFSLSNGNDGGIKVLESQFDEQDVQVPSYSAFSSIYNPDPNGQPSDELTDCPTTSDDAKSSIKHRALAKQSTKWPDGVVPYMFGNLTQETIDGALAAMRDIMDQTCVRFVERTTQNDYVEYVQSDEELSCYSEIGRKGKRQQLHLGTKCGMYKGTVIHETMHALGFEHEQSRVDRDKFVRINWLNIKMSFDNMHQFQKFNGWLFTPKTKTLSSSYSYSSIMHYVQKAYSRNGKNTIEPIQKINTTRVKIGQRLGLDYSDIERIREHYHCDEKDSAFKSKAMNTDCTRPDSDDYAKYDGFVFKCAYQQNSVEAFRPFACLDSIGRLAYNKVVFRDGNYDLRCQIDGQTIKKVPIGCVGDDYKAHEAGKLFVFRGQTHLCTIDNGDLRITLAAADDLRCYPNGQQLKHSELVVNGQFIDQCVIDAKTGSWQLKRLGCASDDGKLVKPGRKYHRNAERGSLFKCVKNDGEFTVVPTKAEPFDFLKGGVL